VLFNPLNAELNPICHLLALLEAHHILHVSRIRVNNAVNYWDYAASMTDEWMNEWVSSIGWMILTGENRNTRRKPIPLPLCPAQILHGLVWEWIQASMVIGQQLTTWAMVWTGIGSISVLTAQGMALDNRERLWSLILRKGDKNWYYNGRLLDSFRED